MAHNLSVRESGFVEFAFTGERSLIWHSLGNEVPENSSLEVWEKESGMDWTIKSTPALFMTEEDGLKLNSVDDKKVLFRSDTLKPLSIVSKDYKVVQPKEILEFFAELIEMNDMKMSTAGVLNGGKRFWALAKTNNSFVVNENDKIDNYLLLVTSTDGTLATIARNTSTRVVCNNTLNISLNKKGEIFKTSHRSLFNAKQVKLDMGLVSESWYNYQETIKKLTTIEVTDSYAKKFIFELVKKPEIPEDKQPKSVDQMYHDIFNKYKRGIGNSGKTAFDLLNGVTEHNTHKSIGRTFDTKFNNTYFGANNNLSVKAYSKLEEEFA